jgi:tetratricopeptide (TPR) repeat protein
MEEALAAARRGKDRWTLGYVLLNSILFPFLGGDYPLGVQIAEEALAIARELGDRQSIASALHNISNALLELGEIDRALAALEESGRLRQELKSPLGFAYSHSAMANLAATKGDYAQAQAYLQQAAEVYQDLGLGQDLAFTLLEMANMASLQGQADEVQRLLAASRAAAPEIKHRLGFIPDFLYGEIAYRRGDYTAALEHFEKALHLSIQSQVHHGIAIAHYEVATALVALGNLTQAREQLRAGARLIAGDLRRKKLVMLIVFGYGLWLKALGQAQRAYLLLTHVTAPHYDYEIRDWAGRLLAELGQGLPPGVGEAAQTQAPHLDIAALLEEIAAEN